MIFVSEIIPSELAVLNCLYSEENTFPSIVNVLTNIPETLRITKRYFFQLISLYSDQ